MRSITMAMAAVLMTAAVPAAASCLVANETAYNFTVASGNTPNQRVGPHARTTIEAGKIRGTADGRTISGACKDGGDLIIKETDGVPRLMARSDGRPGKKKHAR